jgi:hypothetical protein
MPLGHHYEKQARLGANFSYNSEEANFRTSLNGSAGNAHSLALAAISASPTRRKLTSA